MTSFLSRHWKALASVAIVVVVAGLIVVGLANRSTEFPETELTVQGPLPQLTGTDPKTGQTVSTADFAGEPLVVNFWASWCEGCRVEADDIRRFAADRGDDVQVVGVDLSGDDGAARAFIDEFDWEHPSLTGDQRQVGRLNITAMPTTVYVWPDGRIAGRDAGEVTYERLQSVANALDAGPPGGSGDTGL